MIRINLLPPEITQKRLDERRWRWIAVGGIVAGVLVLLVFLFLQFQVSIKQGEVASVQQQAAGLQQQAQRFQIFRQKESELTARRAVVSKALAGRIDWSRLLSEVAMVLPSDVYVTQIGATQPTPATTKDPAAPGSLTMSGKALDVPNDVPDLGYKSVAKLLSRLADLDQLNAVWLTDSAKPAAIPEGTVSTEPAAFFITFGLSAEISSPPTSTASPSGVPAPPSQ